MHYPGEYFLQRFIPERKFHRVVAKRFSDPSGYALRTNALMNRSGHFDIRYGLGTS